MKKLKFKYIFLFIPLLILNILSLFNMFNAKIISEVYINAFYKQLIWFIFGYLIIFIFNKLKISKKIFRLSNYFYIFSIFLLILVLFFGKNINGAKCWLSIFGFSFQPSEIVKITLTLSLINVLNNTKIMNLKDELILIIKYFILTIIPSILVFLEPDTGAVINYLIILIIILFNSKLNKWWYISFIVTLLLGVFSIFIIFFFFQDTLINLIGTSVFYRMDRIINFTNGNSYQLENAFITIGSASFFGCGFNKILLYIPEAPTDFIFSFSIGNFGLFSAILILLSYLSIDIFLIIQSSNVKNNKFKLFINAFLGIFLFHQIYNIFMNIGFLPIMGIPLPFLSYGGTSSLINYLFLGIILNFMDKKNY